ncbi:hypothetical protein [Micromonospora aurantiaca (nom. illeg.)]|uniref:hypothetical protein n=1 Tax=Micromonospora aurantiaca (nom. illeg.) TaxID=47850 RepID=UPI0033F46368
MSCRIGCTGPPGCTGLWVYPEINLISGTDLFTPGIAVLRSSGGGRSAVDIGQAVLLGEIVAPGNRRTDVIDRPPAAADVIDTGSPRWWHRGNPDAATSAKWSRSCRRALRDEPG